MVSIIIRCALLLAVVIAQRRESADKVIRRDEAKKKGRQWRLSGGFEYHPGDPVAVVANKVGPYSNPSETFNYYNLPYCQPENLRGKSHQLGQLLVGDRKVNTPYDIRFLEDIEYKKLCTKDLEKPDIDKWADAVQRDFFFELFIDALPVWGYVGEQQDDDQLIQLMNTEASRTFVYSHLHFDIGHNDNQIVQVNVSFGPPPQFFPEKVDITGKTHMSMTMSYSTQWHESSLLWKDRYAHLHKEASLPSTLEVHWLSIINSFVLVVLLTVFLSIILVRVIKNDFTRYMSAGDEGDFVDEETGWKLIHGDVFRPPEYPMVLSASVGVGVHLLVTMGLVVLLAISNVFDPTRRGAVLQAVIISYAISAFVGGYVTASLYKQLNGQDWAWNVVLAATIVPGPLAMIWTVLNTIAWTHGSTAALPFGTVMVLGTIYLFITCPLTFVGALAGKNTSAEMETPCRTNLAKREIPPIPWYRQPPVSTLLAGFLPFSAIYIELHYIFSSMWGHKMYTLFGILALAFAMLLLVTCFITIAFTYFQLILEDYRWWWRSFFSGGSTGIFVLAYCFYYYFKRSDMHGFMQTSFYFGYMAYMSYCFVLALGALGFYSSLYFVKYIYGSIKCD